MEWDRKVYYGKDDVEDSGGLKPEDDVLNLDSDVVDITTRTIKMKNVTPKTPPQNRVRQSNSSNILGSIIKIIVIVALIIVGSSIYSSIRQSMVRIDITRNLTMSETDIANELGIKFTEVPKEESSFNQYSKGIPVIKKSDDLSLLYLDGKLTGIKIDNKKYTAYNIQIGKTHAEVEPNMTYQYEDSFFILDEQLKPYTVYFYYNTVQNDCIVLAVDKAYQRVISIEYYSDYNKISHDLSSL